MDERLGKVIDWNDARGFGFIEPRENGPRVFFHIRDYRQDGRRPELGEWVKFRQRDSGDRPQATQVWRAAGVARSRGERNSKPRPARDDAKARSSSPLIAWLLVFGYAGLLAFGITRGRLPIEFVGVPVFASVITWIAYALDKHAARTRRWRTPEATLHALELIGGWPGALAAQRMLRHKSRKRSYRIAFGLMIALHVSAVAGWIFMIR